MRKRLSEMVLSALTILALTGCAAADASEAARPTLVEATETAAAEPALPTLTEGTVPPEYEDQYLDLAVEAYLNYLDAGLRVLEQKLDAEALKNYALPSMQKDIDWFNQVATEEGPWKVEGEYKLENTELVNSAIEPDSVRLQFIGCLIDGEVSVSNTEHEHIRDRSNGDRWPIVVIVRGPSDALKLEKMAPVKDRNPCEQ